MQSPKRISSGVFAEIEKLPKIHIESQENCASNTEGLGSIPGQGTKISAQSGKKKQTNKKKNTLKMD